MTTYDVEGIDISHYQQAVDWQLVASQNIEFAFVKATEGSDHQDTLFAVFWQQIKDAEMVRGAYHYFSPFSSPLDQARHFESIVHLEVGDLPPVLDVEIHGELTKADLQKNTLAWLQEIESHYGIKPILYTNQKYYMMYFAGSEFKEYPLWIARYNSPNNPPNIPIGKEWTFWQYGDCGKLEGIKGCVDFNVFKGNKAAFEKLLYKETLSYSIECLN